MPEGPEIRLAADEVAAVLVGQKIAKATFGLKDLRRFESRLTGSRVVAVDTRGKAMLTKFDNGLTLYSHNQLYGRWYTVRRPDIPETKRSLRVALHTQNASALLYSASDIEVLTEKQLTRHPFLTRIGPDILDATLTAAQIVARLEDPIFRNRSLAALYLDQAFLAGNGNYLRSEVLWSAAVSPGAKPASLSPKQLKTLADETLKLARRSYRTRGITVTPRMAKDLRAAGKTYGQYRFYVFGRGGLSCYRCDTQIERHTMGSRNIFICPTCQRQSRRGTS